MIEIQQALKEEAFYAYKHGRARVWVSETVPSPFTRPLFEVEPPEQGENAAKRWFLEIAKLHLKGVTGILSYWIEENDS